MAQIYTTDSPAPQSPAVVRTPIKAWVLILALTLASFGLRIWRIDDKSIWWDESLSLHRARGNVLYILSNRIELPSSSSTDLHPPLYFLLLHITTRLAGESDLALRFPSAAFATLIVPLLYVMGIRLRGVRLGLWAAALGAFSPLYLWYAQEARMYTMVTALGLASFYFLWRALSRPGWQWGLGFGLAASAAMGTQYLSALLLICHALVGIAFALRWRWGAKATSLQDASASTDLPLRRQRKALLWGVGILVLALFFAGQRVIELMREPKAGRGYVSLGVMLLDALNSFSLGLSMEPRQAIYLVPAFGIVFAVGVVSMWKQPLLTRRPGTVMLLTYAVLPIVCMWLLSFFKPIYMGSRYILMCSPAFYLGLGAGLDVITRWRRGAAWAIGAMLIATMGISTQRYFTHERYRTKEDYRSAARLVATNERLGDAVIVTAPENLIAFQHYYIGQAPVAPLPRVALSGHPDAQQIADDLAALAGQYERLWLVHCRTMFSDPENLVTRWLDNHTWLEKRTLLPSYGSDVTVSVYLSRPPIRPDAPILSEPIGTFGGHLSLAECVLRYSNSNQEVREVPVREAQRYLNQPIPSENTTVPGQTIAVRCLWRPLRGLDRYRLSLRLLDERGVPHAQHDDDPLPPLPTTQWPVNSIVRQVSSVRIPAGTPPGIYRLQLWIYSPTDGRALVFQDAADGREQPAAELGRIVVVRPQEAPPLWDLIPPQAQRPLWASVFGESLQLLAYDLAPRALTPGAELGLELYWRALADIDRDYELVINWRDARGRVWSSMVQHPAALDYATSQWHKGETVRSILRLSVPAEAPVGKHSLHVLVRPRDGGAFLWLRQGIIPWAGHDLALGEITIR